MIRRLGYSTWAAYAGGDMWGGRMLGICDTEAEARSLVDTAFDGHLIGESDRCERAYDVGRNRDTTTESEVNA